MVNKYLEKNINNANYRVDIDGLRAIACLSVVIYHAFPNIVKGGFVGVDIFFVISGFLISSILFNNLFNKNNPGKINIIDFYIRRIKRIFPSLITVLIVTMIIGYYILLPNEYEVLGKHILGGATYVNNIMLYLESGSYFNLNSNEKPLLHLWSLGVEEQFYLIFPIFLFLIYRLNLNFVLSILIFTIISFCLNKNGINHNHQIGSFYLPWCRFWELSIGALLAYASLYYSSLFSKCNSWLSNSKGLDIFSKIIFRHTSKDLKLNLSANILSIMGFSLIMTSIFITKNDKGFPGYSVLVPVIGSVLVIAAGKLSIVNRLILSNKIMKFIGLISYPLYLWHWPLLSLGYIYDGGTPNVWYRLVILVLSFICTLITYYMIENPLRYGNFYRIKSFCLLIILSLIGCLGYYIYSNQGLPYRYMTIDPLTIEKISKEVKKKIENCENNYYKDWKEQDNKCYMALEQDKVSVSIFGDSHANASSFGIQYEFSKHNLEFNIFSSSGQIPFYGFKSLTNTGEDYWHNMRTKGSDLKDIAFQTETNNPNRKVFVLFHNPETSYNDLIDKIEPKNNELNISQKYEIGLERTISILTQNNKKILFVLDNPKLPFLPSSCRIKEEHGIINEHMQCDYNKSFYTQNIAHLTYNNAVKNISKKYNNVRYLELSKLFCKRYKCFAGRNGKILYNDDNHLSKDGSIYIAPYIYNEIELLLKNE